MLASAVASPHSAHYNDTAVRKASDSAFEWWLRTDPINSNWWWMQIGLPRIICKYLLLLPDARLLKLAVFPHLTRSPLSWVAQMTGCNRVWGASIHVMRGALEGNSTRMAAAYKLAWSTVDVSTGYGDGIKEDGSFHQHGAQLYSGWGYGGIYTTNVLVLERYAEGSGGFEMGPQLWSVFARLVLDGQQPATRGANFDFLSCGRLFTYFDKRDDFGVNQGHYHYFGERPPTCSPF
jgi:chondroitin AC lyase